MLHKHAVAGVFAAAHDEVHRHQPPAIGRHAQGQAPAQPAPAQGYPAGTAQPGYQPTPVQPGTQPIPTGHQPLVPPPAQPVQVQPVQPVPQPVQQPGYGPAQAQPGLQPAPAQPATPPPGLEKMMLQTYCREYNIPLSTAVGRLARHHITAFGDMTFEELSLENNKTPSDILRLVTGP